MQTDQWSVAATAEPPRSAAAVVVETAVVVEAVATWQPAVLRQALAATVPAVSQRRVAKLPAVHQTEVGLVAHNYW